MFVRHLHALAVGIPNIASFVQVVLALLHHNDCTLHTHHTRLHHFTHNKWKQKLTWHTKDTHGTARFSCQSGARKSFPTLARILQWTRR